MKSERLKVKAGWRVLVYALAFTFHLFSPFTSLQAQNIMPSTLGNDFWVTWLDCTPGNDSIQPTATLTAMGDSLCTVTVNNPVTGWSAVAQIISGGKVTLTLPGYAVSAADGVPAYGRAFHVTSTSDISLLASFCQPSSSGVASILPTDALRKRYIALDYPTADSSHGAQLAFVAIEDSTVISMRLPCSVHNSTAQVGDTLRVTLMAGQSHYIENRTADGSFTGMEVTSNHRFAMFEGNSSARIPDQSTSGNDCLFEQAVPVDMWGTDYALVPTRGRTNGDQVRIVASRDCVVTCSDGNVYTLSAGGSVEFTMSSFSKLRLAATEPVCVGLFMRGPATNGVGDAAMILVPPLDFGVRYAPFATFPADDITNFYLNVVTRREFLSGVEVDGVGVAFQSLDSEYCYFRLPFDSNMHVLQGHTGEFVAWAYGFGVGSGYAYSLGRRIVPFEYDTVDVFDTICQGGGYDSCGVFLTPDETQDTGNTLHCGRVDTIFYRLHLYVSPTVYVNVYDSIIYGDTLYWGGNAITERGQYTVVFTASGGCDSVVTLTVGYLYDTIHFFDTVCQHQPYEGHGFQVDTSMTSAAGNVIMRRYVVEDGLPHCYVLHLRVQRSYFTALTRYIVVGDTLRYADTVLTLQGEYRFIFTAANGCDSTVLLRLAYESVGVQASANAICPGDEVAVTATGTHVIIWSSDPYDPEVASQQGRNPIVVHPMQSTRYILLDVADNELGSATVGTEPPPALRISVNREFLDFDRPVLVFTDSSVGRYTTEWLFSDGVLLAGEQVRRQYSHPLPDSVAVTMTSCNIYGCCGDTLLSRHLAITSVWFPNAFLPGADDNNIFRCVTSFDVASFELAVYNRWGMLVWRTDDVTQGWDGRTPDGVPCPQGAYSYRYFLKATDGDVRNGFGTVTLLR